GVIALQAATSAVPMAFLLLGLLLLPAASWVALCIDNLLFLWMPYRTTPEDPGDVAFVGRTMATALFKFTVLVLLLAVVWWIAFTAYYSGSRVAVVVVPLLTLISACAGGTLAVANGFRRYDVARHAPV